MSATGFDYNQWAAVNLSRPASGSAGDAATPESIVQDGCDEAAGTVGKVTLGVNPSLKDRGLIPAETNVAGGLALQNLTLLKDLPGGVLASVSRYFTLSWEWLLGKSGADGGTGGSGEGNQDGGNAGGSQADSDGLESPALRAPVSFQPEMLVDYGGKLLASEPVDVPLSRLGELTPPETPAVAREELSAGLAA